MSAFKQNQLAGRFAAARPPSPPDSKIRGQFMLASFAPIRVHSGDRTMLDPEEFADTMAEIGRTCMPFGRYGRKEYPPHGIPIYDLPYEYLEWFTYNGGFPSGRLGELLEILFHLKKDGSDEVFAPFRRRHGGRTPLHKKKPREYRFGD